MESKEESLVIADKWGKKFDVLRLLVFNGDILGHSPSICDDMVLFLEEDSDTIYEEVHEYVIGSAGKLSYSSNAKYILLAALHLKNGNVLLASKVISEMMDRGLKPNFSAYKKIKAHLEKKDEK
ncbi:unnamed protein product [Sphenostylis stenocarpa]|uniref:Pentatricopeptide repeat-containing protein n=1 Tax=Sphenostylis stenocarpa TaxID=92480 RepID=A0AA86VF26_9FABA|nr:unnamed protein product [Sphenostylis stenocarpa]